MQEHHFKVEHGDFSAELVLGGEWSLYDFAELIIKTVGFDFDHPFEFCDNLKRPYRSKERYSVFADQGEPVDANDRSVQNTNVSEVFRPKRRMVFHFDYGDDWYFLTTCTAVKESEEKKRFKKVVSKSGTMPEQYPDEE